jgi:hypothetical protein
MNQLYLVSYVFEKFLYINIKIINNLFKRIYTNQ